MRGDKCNKQIYPLYLLVESGVVIYVIAIPRGVSIGVVGKRHSFNVRVHDRKGTDDEYINVK